MIFPIRAFKDNYIWSWADDESGQLWVVDPGDAAPVIAVLNQLSLNLGGVLLTHHHHDHSGGIPDLLKKWPNCQVVRPGEIKDHQSFSFGGMNWTALLIPGHTLDHVAYFNDQALFCGDTLFSAGCGRVFEGTYEQMYASLQKLTNLPISTPIYCGHEYTEANLYFAWAVEPNNMDIKAKLTQIETLRREDKPSLPATLGAELSYNPFLRCKESAVIKGAEKHAGKPLTSPIEVFKVLREWKNNFVF